jgi:hypothetical protein
VADDKKNPWPMVIFFGLALGLLWVLMDTLKPPAAVRAAPMAVDDDSAKTGTAVGPSAKAAASGPSPSTPTAGNGQP